MSACQHWRYAQASVEGTAHTARGVPCQDSSICRIVQAPCGEVLVAVVSDGAGSAARADAGSRLACEVFLSEVERLYKRGELLHEEDIRKCVALLAARVRILAHEERCEPREYACTLIGAVVTDEEAVFFQVGDGAIVAATSQQPDFYVPVFWPQRGEYANTTNFATADDASSRLLFDVWPNKEHDGDPVELALLSDGLQSLALNYQAHTAHTPFFGPILMRLRAEPAGHSQAVSGLLASFLGSSRVNERTDDDKTLVVATRRPNATLPTTPPVEVRHSIEDENPQTAEAVE
jgi:hypothetical protein